MMHKCALVYRRAAALGLALVAVTVVRPAAAAEFGDTGVWSPSGHFQFSQDNYTNASGVDRTAYSLSIAPALMYFVAKNVAVGARVLFSYDTPASGPEFSSSQFGVQLGYNWKVGEKVSLFPKIDVGYSQGTYYFGSGDQVAKTIGVNLYLPLLYHVAPHFFIGGGPHAYTRVLSVVSTGGAGTEGGDRTVLSLESVIGGWF